MTFLHQDAHVQDYVNDGMAPKRRLVMEQHLRRCPACRDLVAEYRRKLRRMETRAQTGEIAVDTGQSVMIGTRRGMVSSAVPVLGSIITVVAFVAVLVAAWNAGGATDSEDLAHPTAQFSAEGVALTGFQVTDLRRAGWSCPDLRPLGLEMTSSVGYRKQGVASVTLSYSGNGRAVVVSETRRLDGQGVAPAAAESGADPSAAGEASAGSDAGQAAAQALDAAPSATITADGARFVVHSTLDAAATDVLVQRVQDLAQDREEDARAAAVGGWDRLSRGFARLVDPTR